VTAADKYTTLTSSLQHDGDDAKKTAALLGLNDLAGMIGIDCQQIPINIIGVAADVTNYCKATVSYSTRMLIADFGHSILTTVNPFPLSSSPSAVTEASTTVWYKPVALPSPSTKRLPPLVASFFLDSCFIGLHRSRSL
jgi:hypothetical protein